MCPHRPGRPNPSQNSVKSHRDELPPELPDLPSSGNPVSMDTSLEAPGTTTSTSSHGIFASSSLSPEEARWHSMSGGRYGAFAKDNLQPMDDFPSALNDDASVFGGYDFNAPVPIGIHEETPPPDRVPMRSSANSAPPQYTPLLGTIDESPGAPPSDISMRDVLVASAAEAVVDLTRGEGEVEPFY